MHIDPDTSRTTASDRAQQDKALIETLAQLPDAVLLLDREWRITYLNRAATKEIPLENQGRSIWELYPTIVGTELEQAYIARLPNSGRFAALIPFTTPRTTPSGPLRGSSRTGCSRQGNRNPVQTRMMEQQRSSE